MRQEEFCEAFDWIEFVRANPDSQAPFSIEQENKDVYFRDVGVIEFRPKRPSNQYLVISAAIHGNETAPIEIVNDWVSELLQNKINLTVNLLFLLGNPKAMLEEQRFVGFNLNRLFNGEWQNYLEQNETRYEAQRACLLEQSVMNFFNEKELGAKRYHYDLHTAIKPSLHQKFAVYPYMNERKHCLGQLKFLQDSGIDTVLLYHKPSTTFSYYTSQSFKADAFTLELGKVKPFGKNVRSDFAQFEQEFKRLLEGQYQFDSESDLSEMNLYQVKRELVKESEMDNLEIDSEVANFTPFDKDQLLLNAGAGSYLTEQDNEAIVFPNNKVAVGQRMGLVVIKTTL